AAALEELLPTLSPEQATALGELLPNLTPEQTSALGELLTDLSPEAAAALTDLLPTLTPEQTAMLGDLLPTLSPEQSAALGELLPAIGEAGGIESVLGENGSKLTDLMSAGGTEWLSQVGKIIGDGFEAFGQFLTGILDPATAQGLAGHL